MNILDKKIVLVLNRNWQAINEVTVRQAIVAMCSDTEGDHPAYGMDIAIGKNANGEDILANATPTSWEDWIKLPVREGDLYLQTAKYQIRVPTVIISRNYDKVPIKTPKFSKENVRRRDNSICQVSGRKLARGEGNMGHIIARAKGGKDNWENVVYMDKELNTKQGTKTPEEMGWKLKRKPFAPLPMPIIIRPEDAKHDTWKHFLAD